MSVDTPNQADPRHDLDVDHVRNSLPKPADHGSIGMMLIDDVLDDDRVSIYDQLRQLWYDVVDSPKDQPVTLGTLERNGVEVAVQFKSSKWFAGEGEDDDYSAYYKYHLKLRPVGADGEVQENRTPLDAVSLTIMPHLRGLVHPDGNPFEPQHGPGTMIHVDKTWTSDWWEFVDAAEDILDVALDGFQLDRSEIVESSRRWWSGEVHHRVSQRCMDDLVHVLRQSEDLIALDDGDITVSGGERSRENGWEIYKWASSRFELLGFDQLDIPKARLLIKAYHTDNPQRAQFPLDQPKLEVALLTRQGERKPHADEWEAIYDLMRTVLLSHLTWAGVTRSDLIADDRSLGPNAEEYEFAHPIGRRAKLREWYKSKVPEIYAEATREYRGRANVTYDILRVLTVRSGATYSELQDETGASYSTIQRHARRLEDLGICERLDGFETLLTWSAPEMGYRAEEVMKNVRPTDSPEDAQERAEERRSERDEWNSTNDTEADSDDESASREKWTYLSRVPVSGEQLVRALDRDWITEDDVRIRVGASPIFATS